MKNYKDMGIYARWVLGGAVLFITAITLLFLIMMQGRGILVKEYYDLFFKLGLVSLVLITIALLADYVRGRRAVAEETDLNNYNVLSNLFLFERNTLRPVGYNIFTGFLLFIALIGGILYAVIGQSFVFFTPPSGYTESMILSTEQLALHTPFENLFTTAVVPGVFEQVAIFFAVSMTVFLLVYVIAALLSLLGLGWRKAKRVVTNPLSFSVIIALACAVWSYYFAWFHGRYEGNQAAQTWAMVFQFVVSMADQFSGMFLSWTVHITHNAAVISSGNMSIILAALVVVPTSRLWMNKKLVALGDSLMIAWTDIKMTWRSHNG